MVNITSNENFDLIGNDIKESVTAEAVDFWMCFQKIDKDIDMVKCCTLLCFFTPFLTIYHSWISSFILSFTPSQK